MGLGSGPVDLRGGGARTSQPMSAPARMMTTCEKGVAHARATPHATAATSSRGRSGVSVRAIDNSAAATTAVWTNDAWFSATAAAVDPATAINLQGAFNADAPGTEPTTGFTAADDDSAAIAIPSTVFADLVAGDTISTTVWLKNAGTSALQIAEPRLVVDGATYTIDNPAAAGLFAEDGATLEVTGAPNALEPGEVAPATVTIALDADASESFGGKSGDVLIQFQGSIANRTS